MTIKFGPNLGHLIDAATGEAHDTAFRSLLRALDTEIALTVLSRTITAPPGSPANGDRYIIPGGSSGVWSAQTNKIATWTTDDPANPTGVWELHTPKEGWLAWSVADAKLYIFTSSAWTLFTTAITEASLSLSDVTTANTSTSMHGFAPKLPNDATKYLDGTGLYSVPAGGGGGGGALTIAGTPHWLICNASTTIDEKNSNTGASGSFWSHLGGTLTAPSNTVSSGKPIHFVSTSPAGSAGNSSLAEDAIGQEGCWQAFQALACYGGLEDATSDQRCWIAMGSTLYAATAVTNPSGTIWGFRFIRGTDTHWMAYVGTAAGTFTAVDTGITPDTNLHQFFMCRNAAGGIDFYIDGTKVCTIASSATGFPANTTAVYAQTNIYAGGSPTSVLDICSLQWWSF